MAKILIAEDDDAIRELVMRALDEDGIPHVAVEPQLVMLSELGLRRRLEQEVHAPAVGRVPAEPCGLPPVVCSERR